jgi:hypothetical protein
MNSHNMNIFPPLSIKVISMGTTLFPLHGKTCSAIVEQTENGSRNTPPTTHLNVRWKKKIRGKK